MLLKNCLAVVAKRQNQACNCTPFAKPNPTSCEISASCQAACLARYCVRTSQLRSCRFFLSFLLSCTYTVRFSQLSVLIRFVFFRQMALLRSG